MCISVMVNVIDYFPGSSTTRNPKGKGKCQGGVTVLSLHLKHTVTTVDNRAPIGYAEKKLTI